MVKNILILGNGFDLAMGRKTSYEDFLRFLNLLTFLLYCQKACNQKLDVKNYNFLLEEYNNLNIASLTKEELQEQIKRKNIQINEKVDSMQGKNNFQEAKILEKLLVSTSEGNDAISYFDKLNFQEELKLYELLSDKVKLGVVLECLSNYCNIKNEQLENFFEENKNDESAVGIVRKIIIMGDGLLKVRGAREKKDDIESKYFLDVDIIDKVTKDYEWLLKIRDNLFLRFINENKSKLGEKWSNIELVISDIAEAISYFKGHLEEFSQIFSNGSDIDLTKIQEKFITKPNFAALSFVVDYLIGHRFDYSIGFQKVIDVCNEKFIESLEDFTDYLEFYLTYLDKLDFEKRKIEKKRSNLDVIEGVENAKVLTFNYTDTANKLFGIPEGNTHFIHGRIDFARKKKPFNTMVFGIEDKASKLENINSDLIYYQKFYQRIIKETGSDYRKFFATIEGSDARKLKPIDDMNIIVFGHSVDTLDKEIFINCFNFTKESEGKYKFIFNYYDEKAKREIVKNLSIILGKEEMISLTAERKVTFVKCDDVEGMKRELL
ncbi:bacteriophage abortive infection AbiH family protein [Streptococcus gallolyticus subsp. gallolyticus]|uniref:AbiH family protein n=1 Tax=Streptococcus gallolyticus TaxID=315405 RepID=UPI002283C78B|nr:AbiH family protein [Streptococcus gallolyticus]MCY7172268.1 bacteriophage abortive infection AbiH family protein [Streptococcus gallolyticus subsp. gallolyticus]